MNGQPPKIEIAYWLDGELQLHQSCEIEGFGCLPAVGDVITDDFHEYFGALRVRRRIFVPMSGERDIWWLLCDELPDDSEMVSLLIFDKEMRAEFKKIEEEDRRERHEKATRDIRELVLDHPKRPSRQHRGMP